MERQYSREEIEFYVSKNLEIVGQKSRADAERIRKDFADTIEKLPPEEQVLLIESRGANIVGDRAEINDLYKELDQNGLPNVNGFFTANGVSLSNDFNRKSFLPEPIAWTPESRDNGRVTMRHEHGHRVDRKLAQWEQKPEYFMSDASPTWADALDREMGRRQNRDVITPESSLNPLSWINKQINKITSRNQPAPLYEGYRELDAHLSYYSDKSTHPREAMAEMSNHRNSLYAKFNGDDTRVDAELSKRYPELWPAYRDEMIPKIAETAQKIINNREHDIDTYVQQMQKRESAAGRPPIDAEQARSAASLSLIDGTHRAEIRKMLTETAFYRYPA
ncbi:MAG: hypothetical protein DI626_06855, partial [Micavibrio aeruginosavorus]